MREIAACVRGPFTLVAVGGYGRGRLSPYSDIDLLVLAPSGAAVSDPGLLRPLLYPLWDAGFEVGHAVRTPRQAIAAARNDLYSATALMTARWLAGDPVTFQELLDRRARWINRDRKQIVRGIIEAVRERHERADRAGWTLAPDLKHDAGGLRDAHTVAWLATVEERLQRVPRAEEELLWSVREALHSCINRKGDELRIDLQPQVANRLGFEHADALMTLVHQTARAIEDRLDAAVSGALAVVERGPRRSGSHRHLGNGVRLADGMLELPSDPRPDADHLGAAMALVAAAARTRNRISPASYGRLRSAFSGASTPALWTDAMRVHFIGILTGEHCVAALELLDHLGAWRALMPEWERVRGLAQHDPYHRFTVDGHLFVTAREVTAVIDADEAGAASAAGSLDTLYLAALLHDIGKGTGQNHSVAGKQLAATICVRMGLVSSDADEVAELVRHHLLLPDSATRRDADDNEVVASIADAAGTPRRLRLLYILAAADGRATGPGAWTEWKSALVHRLYQNALVALETGELPVRREATARAKEIGAIEPAKAGEALETLRAMPPAYADSAPIDGLAAEVRLLSGIRGPGDVRVRIDPAGGASSSILVALWDRPGALAHTAGVLAVHGTPVRRAQAYTASNGRALQRLIVGSPRSGRWERVLSDLEASLGGRIAPDARLAEVTHRYRPRPTQTQGLPVRVNILGRESRHSTVVEVRAADTPGLLFAITSAIFKLGLDVHLALIDTLGERVVDVFYVRTRGGAKLDEDQAAALERSIHDCIRDLAAARS